MFNLNPSIRRNRIVKAIFEKLMNEIFFQKNEKYQSGDPVIP